MKFYLITCHKGHVGTGKSRDITFAIMAENLIIAMDTAKKMPGVKHTRGIIAGKEIDEDTFREYRKQSAYQRG